VTPDRQVCRLVNIISGSLALAFSVSVLVGLVSGVSRR